MEEPATGRVAGYGEALVPSEPVQHDDGGDLGSEESADEHESAEATHAQTV